ncbi:MAG: D-glycerate dehydrogenase, partial [Ignavibacteriaceae bacterium]
MVVFITSKIPEIGIQLLQKKYGVKIYSKPNLIPRNVLIEEVKKCAGLISLLTDKIDKEVIDSMQNCRVVANYAVGFNNIDIVFAKRKGIVVTNT